MSQRLEVKWSAAIAQHLRTKHGFMVCPLLGNEYTMGWPDKLLIGPKGLCFFAEFKNVHTPIKPLQLKTLQEIDRRIPGSAVIIRRREDNGGDMYSPALEKLTGFQTKAQFYDALLNYAALRKRERDPVDPSVVLDQAATKTGTTPSDV